MITVYTDILATFQKTSIIWVLLLIKPPRTVCVGVSSDNKIRKLRFQKGSTTWKCKKNVDVSSEGLSKRTFCLYFQVVEQLSIRSFPIVLLIILWHILRHSYLSYFVFRCHKLNAWYIGLQSILISKTVHQYYGFLQ